MANLDTTPQTVTTTALQALPFDSLIGGPLKAAINAQAIAAKTTWEFINEVGLWIDPVTQEKKAVNVTFAYQKDGEMVNLVVPLLTIVPIPYISVDALTIDFIASISASSSSVTEDVTSESVAAGGSGSIRAGWGPISGNINFNANYSSKKDSKSSQDSRYSVEYTMNVHVAASQASMPAGLGAVLNILQGAITEAKPRGSFAASPSSFTLLQRDVPVSQTLRFVLKNNQGAALGDQPIKIKWSGVDGITAVARGDKEIPLSTTDQELKTDAAGIVEVVITVQDTALLPSDLADAKTVTITATSLIQNPSTGPGSSVPPGNTVTGVAKGTFIGRTKDISIDDVNPPAGGYVIAKGTSMDVELVVKNSGKPMSGQTIVAKSQNDQLVSVESETQKTDQDGKATFKVTRLADSVQSTNVTFSADGKSLPIPFQTGVTRRLA